MERRRNFFPLAGFLVCVAAFLSYFLVFYRFPATRDVPWVNWLLLALGLVLVAVGVARPFRRPELYKGRILSPVLGVLSVAVAGFFLFVTLVASRDLPVSAGAPRVGQKAPDFVLQDAQGQSVRLYDLLGGEKWVVLIFYRGYW